MNIRVSSLLAGALALLGALLANSALADDWFKIADKVVDYKSETDEVTPKFDEKNVTHIRLVCTQGTVNLHKIVLHMSDGSDKEVDNLGVLTDGMSSRVISVPKGDAKLKKISLKYDSMGSKEMALLGLSKKAHVDIMGKDDDKDKSE
ncbi:hypothetical protein [Shewanella litorisediminis]|uniref:Uncharacterized protein n=1 Tax=Shewanella litorisediminis TaxID=1173586 RepID=A0ABX7G7E3_9GAMM|nr:hypothetical protein [Shewanella litorisediminis]MCL2916712.1 hypothetical protein [Shewanella litorisediminis]QRH03117.1 hypothetical protein JQC75_06845 [Shewanella litorisediminis]